MRIGNERRPIAGYAFIALFSIVLWAANSWAADPAIEFKVPIPAPPGEIQIYNTTLTAPPVQFVNRKLTAAKLPTLTLNKALKLHVARSPAAAGADEEVHAVVNETTGETHLVPSLARLVKTGVPLGQHKLPAAHAAGQAALADPLFIPKDDTTLQASEGIQLLGSEAGAPANAEPKVIMTLVPATRHAGGLRVYGHGSHALVTLDNNNAVVGAMRRWHTAKMGEKIKPTVTVAQVRAAIERQLKPNIPPGAKAVVDVVTHAYYDANGNFLQPVYRFEANLVQIKGGKIFARIAGYVPMGKPLEPIPDLTAAAVGVHPTLAAAGKMPAALPEVKMKAKAGSIGSVKPTVTVGEFVNQDWPNNPAYEDMANNFLSGITSVSTCPVTFSRTIWWTAYSWQVNSPSSKTWMNAVNIAYTVPHGDWLINTCLSDYGDIWYVNKIGTGGNPGFGAAAGGVMSTWVIASCEVIPSMYDYQHVVGGDGNPQHAFDAWWGVFQGLHSVVGFRTVMFYPDDATMKGFGQVAAQGVDVHTAWFQEVAAYHANEGTYLDTHINQTVHYDRASAIVDARNLGQPIYNVTAQSKATKLWNFWMEN